MIMRNLEMLQAYAKDNFLRSDLPVTEEQFVEIFCRGYLDALDSVILGDLSNAEKLIETVKSRVIDGTDNQKIFMEWEMRCSYCGNLKNDHTDDCPTLTNDLPQ